MLSGAKSASTIDDAFEHLGLNHPQRTLSPSILAANLDVPEPTDGDGIGDRYTTERAGAVADVYDSQRRGPGRADPGAALGISPGDGC